ncbi:5-formyltetrahydrofolate cyclo-ligase [Eubacteriales bacterium mix99]|jgi:5-formyltetrahydrofolate cyclo-ligase
MNKREIRRNMASARDRIPDRERQSRSQSIERHLTALEAYEKAEVLLTYASFRSEADTLGLIRTALETGKRVVVPVCVPNKKRILPCEIQSPDDLMPGYFGIPEPPKQFRRQIRVEEIDLAVIPGLAFDRKFNRLGYGAGYYDRFLPKMRRDAAKIGIGFAFQLVDQLPADPFDVPMDGIITDSDWIGRK